MLVGVGIFEPSFCLIGLEGCLWRELEWGGWDLVRVGCLGFSVTCERAVRVVDNLEVLVGINGGI